MFQESHLVRLVCTKSFVFVVGMGILCSVSGKAEYALRVSCLWVWGGAFVTDEAQKWIALTPTAVRCVRNTNCLQRGFFKVRGVTSEGRGFAAAQ